MWVKAKHIHTFLQRTIAVKGEGRRMDLRAVLSNCRIG
jgi:hypothetical protein